MKTKVYLDYAASTPLDPRVEKAMRPYYSSVFGNPSAIHMFGQEASGAVFHARKAIGDMLNAYYREVIFTGSATEANNLAIRGCVEAFIEKSLQKPKILISVIEHESIRAVCTDLKEAGIEVVDIPVDNLGIIDVEFIKRQLDERVILVSIQYANSEIGVVQPIAEIGRIIAAFKGGEAHPFFHVDAVQAFQYFACDVLELGVDMLTLSAHKIYGPKGIGCLYVKKPEFLMPLIVGGGQEHGLRSGTENVPAIVGFAKALEITEGMRAKESGRVCELRDLLWDGIKAIVPDAELNGSLDCRVPNNLNVYFPGHSAQDMCIELDMQGVAVSPGTACSSRASQPSYVIEALGFSGDRPSSSLRFSLGRQTTRLEIRTVLKVFKTRFGTK